MIGDLKKRLTREEFLQYFSVEGFSAWLLSKEDDTVVGVSALCGGCPISRYLEDRGFSEVKVGNVFDMGSITIDGKTLYFEEEDCQVERFIVDFSTGKESDDA